MKPFTIFMHFRDQFIHLHLVATASTYFRGATTLKSTYGTSQTANS